MPVVTRRYFASATQKTFLLAPIGTSDTSISVTNFTGAPANVPWTAIVDRGNSSEEIVEVTAVNVGANTTLTVNRGIDGSTPKTHAFNATFEHGVSARDYDDHNLHETSTSQIHGLSPGSALVGTADVQTLTNKTLTTPTIASFVNADHDHSSLAQGGPTPKSMTAAARAALTGVVTGTFIQESDTGRLLRYNGTGWVWVAGGVSGAISTIGTGPYPNATYVTGVHIPAQGYAYAVDIRFNLLIDTTGQPLAVVQLVDGGSNSTATVYNGTAVAGTLVQANSYIVSQITTRVTVNDGLARALDFYLLTAGTATFVTSTPGAPDIRYGRFEYTIVPVG